MMNTSTSVTSDSINEQQKTAALIQPQPTESTWRSFWNTFTRNPKVAFGLSLVGFFFLLAAFGPLLIHGNPNALSADTLSPPSPAHWLGTTQTGQDILGQLLQGTRVSLFMGFAIGIT